jgi:acetoin utilization protein AcuB
MKSMPKIEKVMTAMPHTIESDQPIRTALTLMRENGIRHLPVQKAGELVGVLSDRDIKMAASFAGAGLMKVEEVMTPDPYFVKPGAPLDDVVDEMAAHKYGCAIVRQDNGKVVGIFTSTDALHSLSDALRLAYNRVA